MYRNKLYSLAWGLCPVALIANTRLLREAGIELPPQPMTLDAFFDVCQQVDRAYQCNDIFSYALSASADKETDFLTIYFLLQAFRGGFMNERGEIIFHAPETVAAFEWLRRFVRACRVLKADIPTIRKRFAQGEIAFISDGPWLKCHLEELTGEPFEERFQVVLNPIGQDGLSRSWNYNHALAICSQSAYPMQAARFIDAVTTDDDLCDLFAAQTGILPANTQHLDNAVYASEFFRGYKRQLEHSACINAQNAMFAKAMYFCLTAARNILESDCDIERELREEEVYLNMLYEE